MRVKDKSEKVGLKLNIQKTIVMASSPITTWQIEGERVDFMTDVISWAPKSLQTVTAAMKLKDASPWKESHDKPSPCSKKQRHHFADKGLYSQSYGFSSSHVWMLELDHKEDWVPKNWCFQIAVLEKTHESTLDSKEIKPVNLKGNQLWTFIGRTDAEGETPILWPPEVKSQLTGKDCDAGKDCGQEKGMTEDEMTG